MVTARSTTELATAADERAMSRRVDPKTELPATYLPLRAPAPLLSVVCGQVVVGPPSDETDMRRIARWLRRPEIRGALGFPRALPRLLRVWPQHHDAVFFIDEMRASTPWGAATTTPVRR